MKNKPPWVVQGNLKNGLWKHARSAGNKHSKQLLTLPEKKKANSWSQLLSLWF